MVVGIIGEWQNELVMGRSGKSVNPPLPIYFHWRDSKGTGKCEAPAGWFSDKKEEIKQSVETLGKKSIVKLQEQTILKLSQEMEVLQLEASEWKRKWEETNQQNLELANRVVTQNRLVDGLHEELSQARQNARKLRERERQGREKVEARALKTIGRLEAEIKDMRSTHARKIGKWKEDYEGMKKEAEDWKSAAQSEADGRLAIQEEDD